MKRVEFDHAIRAAGAVLGEREVLVIGSQAVHASLPEPIPAEAERSIEVDIVPFLDPDGLKADLIDGSIGEASLFQQTFGFYAQGVSETTAVLPKGWRDRLIEYEAPGTSGVVAWCLELHDLWISKAVAGHPKDLEFCRALLEMDAVETSVLHDRREATDNLKDAIRSAVSGLLE